MGKNGSPTNSKRAEGSTKALTVSRYKKERHGDGTSTRSRMPEKNF